MRYTCLGCGEEDTPQRAAKCIAPLTFGQLEHTDVDSSPSPLVEVIRGLSVGNEALTKNLTATQTRCNELLLETRAQRLAAHELGVGGSAFEVAVERARKRLKEG